MAAPHTEVNQFGTGPPAKKKAGGATIAIYTSSNSIYSLGVSMNKTNPTTPRAIKPLRELLIIAVAVALVVGATYSVSRSWFVVAIVFLSGLGLGAVWLIVKAIHTLTGHKPGE